MKHILFYLLTISSAFALTGEEVVALNKKSHDEVELVKELQIFPTSKKISSELTIRIPNIPDQKDTLITESKNIEGKYLVRETNIIKEELNINFIHVIKYSNELKRYKMWTRSRIIYQDNDPIVIVIESDGLLHKGAQVMTWTQVPDKSNPTHSVVISHLKPEGEHWIAHDYQGGKIVSIIEGVDTLMK